MLGLEEPLSTPVVKGKSNGSRRKLRTVDIATIEQLERDDCIEGWWQLFGVMPPKYTSLEFMRKALAYEAQVNAFGGHSNAVQRALKASLKTVRSEVETGRAADANVDAHVSTAAACGSCADPNGVIETPASNIHQTIRPKNIDLDAYDQISITGRGSANPNGIQQTNGKADTKTIASLKPYRSTKPSVLSIRAGTHLVREWNGRTYQVEALEKGYRLDGKTYRSLSAVAKKITGSHWSGPRFFGLER